MSSSGFTEEGLRNQRGRPSHSHTTSIRGKIRTQASGSKAGLWHWVCPFHQCPSLLQTGIVACPSLYPQHRHPGASAITSCLVQWLGVAVEWILAGYRLNRRLVRGTRRFKGLCYQSRKNSGRRRQWFLHLRSFEDKGSLSARE